MIDYVNEDHGLETIQHNFSCEAHGKGIHDAEGGMRPILCLYFVVFFTLSINVHLIYNH